MATHSSTLAWKIPWRKEPGGLPSVESQCWTRLSDWACTHTHTHTHTHTLRNGIRKFFKSHSQSVVASDWNQSKLSMWPSFRMKVSPLSTCWMVSPWMLSQIFQQVLDWMFVLCWIGRCNSQETLRQNKATRRASLDSVSWQTSLNWISFHVKGSISGKVLKKLFSCEKALELVPWVLASDFRRWQCKRLLGNGPLFL